MEREKERSGELGRMLILTVTLGLAGAGAAGCNLGTGPSTLEADSTDTEPPTVGSLAPEGGVFALSGTHPARPPGA